MSDFIEIKDLLVRTIIGINPDERKNRQDVVINLKFQVDIRPAGASDDIEDAVNYRTICKSVIAFVEESKFQLVEKLAEEVARLCLKDERIERVWVSIEKPGALRFSRTVGVTIERSQTPEVE
ncbi:dihydroneopterin aldolase [Thalassoglobus polymorphus]|uniref:7,8-dihydroneopterin aldolase n=1 Tax=Thalassoglobus polymorphus TaxID=2527994 RepID=A0A517QJQ1_9PLAN|nr:dihydroneopterin aldolase [Thalassoglobus polymorphus]QDT31872.1 D-erythro-7,8-dihydroneopterin triphosphate epimerase [Thalassoglobus polymorphus]